MSVLGCNSNIFVSAPLKRHLSVSHWVRRIGLPPSPVGGLGLVGGIFNPLRYGKVNELTTKVFAFSEGESITFRRVKLQ